MLSHPLFGLGINNFWRAECFESDKARTHRGHRDQVQRGA
jgi:hypothetical protein